LTNLLQLYATNTQALAMSSVRQRQKGSKHTESPSKSATPTSNDSEFVKDEVEAKKSKSKQKVRMSKRRIWLIFALGGLVGVLGALAFATQQKVIDIEGLLDLNLESLMDVIPAGILKDAKELTVG
jgi:phospholipid:diacylglycerol acyltransferase